MIGRKTALVLRLLARLFSAAGAVISGAMGQAGAIEWPSPQAVLLAAVVGIAASWSKLEQILDAMEEER